MFCAWLVLPFYLYKALQPGADAIMEQVGLQVETWPGGAYFTTDYALAAEYEFCYQSGILTVEVGDGVYASQIAQLAQPYLSNPIFTEIVINQNLYQLINQSPWWITYLF